jgi:hypothetical protein
MAQPLTAVFYCDFGMQVEDVAQLLPATIPVLDIDAVAIGDPHRHDRLSIYKGQLCAMLAFGAGSKPHGVALSFGRRILLTQAFSAV